jgi:hypothetical protein
MAHPTYCLPMLSADATAALNSTTDLTGTALSVATRDETAGVIYLYVKGDDAAAIDVLTFTFQRSPDGILWVDWFTMAITATGTAQVTGTAASKDVDLTYTRNVRLSSVHNAETTADGTSKVNAYIQFK